MRTRPIHYAHPPHTLCAPAPYAMRTHPIRYAHAPHILCALMTSLSQRLLGTCVQAWPSSFLKISELLMPPKAKLLDMT